MKCVLDPEDPEDPSQLQKQATGKQKAIDKDGKVKPKAPKLKPTAILAANQAKLLQQANKNKKKKSKL